MIQGTETPFTKGFYNGYNDLKTPNPYDSAEDAYNDWIEGREKGIEYRARFLEEQASEHSIFRR